MRVLVVAAAVPPNAFGGSDVYADELAGALASRHDVHVFCRGPLEPGTLVRSSTRGAVTYTTFANRPAHPRAAARRLRETLIETLDTFRPDVVHIHHLRNMPLETPRLASERGSAVVYALHDFSLICQRTFLVTPAWTPCDGPGIVKCWDCLSRIPDFFPRTDAFARATGRSARAILAASPPRLLARRRRLRDMLAHVDLLVSPSRHLRDRMARELGLPDDALAVSALGIAERGPRAPIRLPGARLRVGYIGAVQFHKGVHVLLDAFRDGLDAELVVVGAASPEFEAAKGAELRARASVRGPVAAEHRAAAFDEIDVLVLPSVHHENAPMVIQEAFAAGVPVIGADLAGMAEAIRDGVDGLLFRPGDADDLRRVLQRVIDDRALLDRLAKGVPPVKTFAADVAEVTMLYERARARRARRRA